MIIAAISAFYAFRAARASRATVELTKELRWEADVRRILDALGALRRAAENLNLAKTNPSGGLRGAQEAYGRVRDAQQSLDSALAFPRLPSWDDRVLEALERLRTRAIGIGDTALTEDILRDVAYAEGLLPMPPLPPKMPKWYIRAITFRARRRARGPARWPHLDGLFGGHRDRRE